MQTISQKTGTQIGPYTVNQVQPVPELNLTAISLSHRPTGARLLHIASEDVNNVFAVGFRTPPPDSSGIAHILEHTVLCGSQKYPVRDPFFAMLKRSLNTFMNALTAADWTLYPVASMNEKDFYNLMGIYLDATFFPLLREQDFLQEGHRLDFADPSDPETLTIKGVVFNEMKGAMADPASLLGRRMNASLFPGNCYGFNSGGEPIVIPQLTWKDLRAFHAKYYHPSNSWIYTYGNLPMEKSLENIDRFALSQFEKLHINSSIPLQSRFNQPVRVTNTFPVEKETDLAKNSMIHMAWLTCPIENSFERAATGILANLLLGNPSSPLYQALIESGLGRNLSPGTGYHDDYRDTFIAAGLQGADESHVEEIESLVISTLTQVARNGFPQERIGAALHQYEFSNREVTGDQYPYGLGLLMRLFGPWLHADDPLRSLMLNDNLKQLQKKAADNAFFPSLIDQYLLRNVHRVTLLLRPDLEHNQRDEKAFEDYLQTLKQELDAKSIQLIKQKGLELQTIQETPDDTSCLPILELEDIVLEEQPVHFKQKDLFGSKVLSIKQPTNGISYLTFHFDLSSLDISLRPYLPLFCVLLPQIGAADHDYLAMSQRITAVTGGVRLGAALLEAPDSLTSSRPVLELKAKALDRNQEPLCEILTDMLTAPDFSDLRRISTVIGQIRTSMENSIPGAGHTFAARAAAASLTPSARQREEWNGMTQIQFIRHASQLDERGLAELSEIFTRISKELFIKAQVKVAMTSEVKALATFESPLNSILTALPEQPRDHHDFSNTFSCESTYTAWAYNVPVAYVVKVFRTVPFTHPDAPGLMVLSKLLRSEFLHREIREKGGAYGGMAAYNADGGLFSMLSYRDPHLERTLDVYDRAAQWACQGNFNDQMLKESILSAFAELDRPLSPKGRGYREFLHQEQGVTNEMIQSFRQGIIETNGRQLRQIAKTYLQQESAVSSVGVLAGDEMFTHAKKFMAVPNLKLCRIL